MIKVPIPMQNILNLIDSIPELAQDIKSGVITLINSLDMSEFSIVDIRAYIEHIKNEITKTISGEQSDCYYKLLMRLNLEKESRPFNEQFPEINLSMKEMQELAASLLKTSIKHDQQLKTIQNINNKKDIQLEKFVNDSISNYFTNGIILASGYKYKTNDDEDGELDGIIIGKDEHDKNVIVFVETKSDMDSGWKTAQKQMYRSINHWRFLCELVSDDNDDNDELLKIYKMDIDTLKVKEYKNYKVRCAFGANVFSQTTIMKFKQFNRYNWLSVIKTQDSGFSVVRRN